MSRQYSELSTPEIRALFQTIEEQVKLKHYSDFSLLLDFYTWEQDNPLQKITKIQSLFENMLFKSNDHGFKDTLVDYFLDYGMLDLKKSLYIFQNDPSIRKTFQYCKKIWTKGVQLNENEYEAFRKLFNPLDRTDYQNKTVSWHNVQERHTAFFEAQREAFHDYLQTQLDTDTKGNPQKKHKL